jgi:aminopeptidase N
LWGVRAPRGWRVVTNAPQCRPAVMRPAPARTCLLSAPIPTYTMVLGAGVMTVSRHRAARIGQDTIPIEVWTYPEDSAFADSMPFRRATEIVETLGRLVGPFPYAKLAHVQSSTRYGGMENATAIFYAEQPYVARTMREGVVRHETAHQWFGDAVTEKDWHDLWLSEGFASYFDLVVGAALDGDSVLNVGMRKYAANWMASGVVNRPVIDTAESDPNRLLNANVYPKGAWVLHMLRELVGDSSFFRGIREYYATYRDSSVLTEQFQAAMEHASGLRLGWFFGQWLRQPGYPQLDVAWRADSASRQVTLEVAQTQPGAWGTFALPAVPVAFMREGRVIALRAFQLLPQNGSRVYTFDLAEVPDAVIVDPDRALLMTSTVRND